MIKIIYYSILLQLPTPILTARLEYVTDLSALLPNDFSAALAWQY
jgi:hypothetical protein